MTLPRGVGRAPAVGEVFGSLSEELAALRVADLYRAPRVFEGRADRTVVKDGRELLCFASNNYLGLTTDEAVVRAASEAALSYGAGSGASRLVSGTMQLHVRRRLGPPFFSGAASPPTSAR